MINNSLGNLPSSLFSNLGNLTELYVEIYMYRSLFIVSLTQFISRYIYIYIDTDICSVIWAKEKGLDNSLVGGGTQDGVQVFSMIFLYIDKSFQ